ncbi:MAG TPA: zinc carboxypeptidase, partial [Chitinophagaceae bacterium]|nr:zinc carboxypeptidase [Chitinophagaceae bacterium]
LTPAKNQELTGKLAKYHAAFLDRIGSLYFTKENYDDFYYGKGSTYPDVQGCIGILFEQASSRGHLQQTANGLLSFPFTIRNQFVTTLSTLQGAKELRKEFLNFQRDFYKQSTQPEPGGVSAYIFGDKNDAARTRIFADMLLRHQIVVNELGETNPGNQYEKGKAFVVSLNQPQRQLIKGIFENVPEYKDSLFYDITAWNLPLAFGLPHTAITAPATLSMGKKLESVEFAWGKLPASRSNIGYLIEWTDYFAPAALYELLNKQLTVKVVSNPMEIPIEGQTRKFNYGTLLVPVSMQSYSSEQIHAIISAVTTKYGLQTYAMTSGNAISGSDPGSGKMQVIARPSIAMITGTGVNATDAGEIWHLLDQRMNIPATHLEPALFNRIELNKYNTLIMVGGNYADLNKEKLKSWV